MTPSLQRRPRNVFRERYSDIDLVPPPSRQKETDMQAVCLYIAVSDNYLQIEGKSHILLMFQMMQVAYFIWLQDSEGRLMFPAWHDAYQDIVGRIRRLQFQ